MSDSTPTHPEIVTRLVEFCVLALTFLLSSLYLSIEIEIGLILLMIAYSATILVFVIVTERVLAGYWKSISSATRQILGNGAGIVLGTCFIMLLVKYMFTNGELLVEIVVSSIMAFFILGTLSPIIHRKTPSH